MCTGMEILALAGTATSVIGTITGARDQAAALEYQADMATQQASIDEQNARRRGSMLISQQKTGYAKAGVEVSGTPAEVLAETAADVELEALTARWGGQSTAVARKMEASATKKAGMFKAAGTILTGTHSAFGS